MFQGTGVALITPFNKDLTIDFDAYRKIIEYVIEEDIDFLVPLGSTGETATLNEEEARQCLDFVIHVNDGRKPILAGNFGGNNTLELCKKIAGYNFEGIDGILSSSPSYVKPNQEGIFSHYMALAEASSVPIMIYNVPGRTKSNIEWDTTIRLANASKKFIGIKEASGDLIQATRIIKNKPEGFIVTSGDDEVALPMIATGGDGVISVIANACPGYFSRMTRFCRKGNLQDARDCNFKTYDLHKWLYIEGNPVGIKSAMEVLGFCENHVRLPLHTMSQANYESLKKCVLEIYRISKEA
ncbi:4-hydroxy-tetrahydrodipicolinate synthase [bacterium]|nr:4-hydroxy-tetrahydrodipicolinate synthase [bacterium]